VHSRVISRLGDTEKTRVKTVSPKHFSCALHHCTDVSVRYARLLAPCYFANRSPVAGRLVATSCSYVHLPREQKALKQKIRDYARVRALARHASPSEAQHQRFAAIGPSQRHDCEQTLRGNLWLRPSPPRHSRLPKPCHRF
jgi:hypothetical protein